MTKPKLYAGRDVSREAKGVRLLTERGRFVARTACTSCDATETLTNRGPLPPNVAAAKIKAKGWELGNLPTCPACIIGRRKAKPTYANALPAIADAFALVPSRPNSVVVTQVENPAPPVLPSGPSYYAVDIPELPVKDKPGWSVAEVMCDSCGDICRVSYAGSKTQIMRVKAFRDVGWSLGVRGCFCPKHRTTMKRTTPTITITAETVPMTNALATTAAPASTEAAKAAKRLAFNLMDEHFQDGRYSGGYDDAKVAAESKLALPAVITLREEMFGELKIPAELTELRRDIEKARQNAQAAAASANVAADVANTAADACRALEVRLAAFIKTNGWKA